MEYFYQVEDRDGARFSWNVWPASKVDAANLVVPLGCMYTPLKKAEVPMVFYEPIMCRGACKSFLNPFCQADLNSKMWVCPFCGQHNQFPAHYHGMTATNLPAELMSNVTSIEYALPQSFFSKTAQSGVQMTPIQQLPAVFLFVIDLCVSAEELQKLKDSLLQCIETLPKNAHIGIITFGTCVQVYDLKFTLCAKSYVFKGTASPTIAEVQASLGVGIVASGGKTKPTQKNNYIVSLEESEESVVSTIEQLRKDATPVKNDKRPLRSTGVAVSLAISLMELTFAGQGGRIMVFMGGPCTQGPGLVVSEPLNDEIRSHSDLNKYKAKHVSTSITEFRKLAEIVAKNGHAVDLFSCSLDQTGLLEMKALSKQTGGLMILADGFDSEVFQRSFLKIFEKDGADSSGHLQMGLNASIEVVTSPEIKVQGAIGHLFSMEKKGHNVSDKEVGIGNTSMWRACAIDPSSTYAFYFEVTSPNRQAIPAGRNGMVQFLTMYQHSNGHRVLRVTTLAHGWSTGDIKQLTPGFDQEAAAALIARLAVFKAEMEESNPIRWLDKTLVVLLNRFSEFRKGDPSSLMIPNEMNIYHQFMFYLRRGPLIQVFNNSPDETVYFRYYLQRECVANVLIMIQPTLESYTLDNEPAPVLLSAASVTKDNALLLDTFYHIIVHYGTTLAKWVEAGYDKNPEYENVAELIAMPKADAAELIANRMPMPMYVVCNQGTSQARFLLASVDPAITHTSGRSEDGQVVLTEDVNLQIFVDSLYQRVVEFENN